MSEAKYTPGKWVIYLQSDGLFSVRSHESGIRIAKDLFEGDARLIAESPVLLAEAKELLGNVEYLGDGYARILTKDAEALEASIAKAEGREEEKWQEPNI